MAQPSANALPHDDQSDSLDKLLSRFDGRLEVVEIETQIGDKRHRVSVRLFPSGATPEETRGRRAVPMVPPDDGGTAPRVG